MTSGIGRVRRLVYLMAIAFAAIMLGGRAYVLWSEHDAALARAEASVRDVARLVEEYALRTFQTSDLVTGQMVQGVTLRGGVEALRGNEEGFRWLRGLVERTAGDYLMVVDETGMPVVVSAQHPAPGTPLGDREWFRAHREGAERHVGRALFSRITGEILFTYTRAIRDALRDQAADPTAAGPPPIEGVVQVATRLGVFHDLAAGVEGPPDLTIGLWTVDGEVIARTGLQPGQIGRLMLPEALTGLVRTARSGALRTGVLGPERILAWRRLEGWPVIATASLPVEAALAPFHRDLVWSAWLGAALLLALIGLSWTARSLGLREERALAGLAAANAALEEARGALEARVEERTRALGAANRLLAEKEARFRGIFDSQFQLIGLLAPEGGRVTEVNRTALAFWAADAEAVIGRPFRDLPWWEQDAAGQERLCTAIAEAAAGGFARFEAETRGADGRAAILDVSIKPVRDEAGRITWLVAEGRDITALKAAQAQLLEAQKLETLGQLTGGIAHDFNNLLMAILGNLALLRKRLPAEEARMHRLLDGAVQGAQRGAALTQRLLAFARRQELRPEAIDPARLVHGMVELLQRSLGPAVQLVVDVPAGLPRIRADANQLEMALLNLAVNARDAMPEGGTLSVVAGAEGAPGVVRPAALPEGGAFLCIAVSDSGTGMDAATLKRATEPFFTTKGPGKGSGLGLSMVHGLAAQSGGHLAIESRPGRGTTVALWLPVAEGAGAGAAEADPSAADRAPPAALPPTGPLSILLVDDDPLIQAGTAAMLEDLGHRVVVAGTGLAALEALAEASFGLVVTDFAMPGMDGLALVRRIRAERPGLPVVLATGYADLAEGQAPLQGVMRIAKPYRQEDLAEAIARALRPGPAAPSRDAPAMSRAG